MIPKLYWMHMGMTKSFGEKTGNLAQGESGYISALSCKWSLRHGLLGPLMGGVLRAVRALCTKFVQDHAQPT